MSRKICNNCLNFIDHRCIFYNCPVRCDGTCKHHILNKHVVITPDIRIEKHEVYNPVSASERYIYHLYVDNNLEGEYTYLKDLLDHINVYLTYEF